MKIWPVVILSLVLCCFLLRPSHAGFVCEIGSRDSGNTSKLFFIPTRVLENGEKLYNIIVQDRRWVGGESIEPSPEENISLELSCSVAKDELLVSCRGRSQNAPAYFGSQKITSVDYFASRPMVDAVTQTYRSFHLYTKTVNWTRRFSNASCRLVD